MLRPIYYTDELKVVAGDACDKIVARFHEIFVTHTFTRVMGNQLITLVYTRGIALPEITVYTIDIVYSETPFRYTTISVKFSEPGTIILGAADSMSTECYELYKFVKNIVNEPYFGSLTIQEYTTHGD